MYLIVFTELDHGLSETQIKCIAKQMFEVQMASLMCLVSYGLKLYRVLGSCTVLNAFIEI